MSRKHLLQVPAERLRQSKQPECLSRGRTVDDNCVPLTTRGQIADREQGQDLLDAREDGELLRRDRVHATSRQDVNQVPLQVAPGDLEASLGVDLCGPQARMDLGRLTAEWAGQRVRQ